MFKQTEKGSGRCAEKSDKRLPASGEDRLLNSIFFIPCLSLSPSSLSRRSSANRCFSLVNNLRHTVICNGLSRASLRDVFAFFEMFVKHVRSRLYPGVMLTNVCILFLSVCCLLTNNCTHAEREADKSRWRMHIYPDALAPSIFSPLTCQFCAETLALLRLCSTSDFRPRQFVTDDHPPSSLHPSVYPFPSASYSIGPIEV